MFFVVKFQYPFGYSEDLSSVDCGHHWGSLLLFFFSWNFDMFRHFEDVRQWCIVISLRNFALWSSYYSVFFCWFVHSFAVMAALKIFLCRYYVICNWLEEVECFVFKFQSFDTNLGFQSFFMGWSLIYVKKVATFSSDFGTHFLILSF